MKKLIQNILKTPLFTHNPLYRAAYIWNVRRMIPKLLDKPRRVIVENTNFCNMSCSFCGNPHMKRKKGYMPHHLFEKIVDQCNMLGVPHLYVFGIGEPLLDPEYDKKLAYAYGRVADIHCVTNGTIYYKLPPIPYFAITVNDDSVIDNLKKFRKDMPYIECRFKEDTKHLIKYCKPYCDKVNVYLNVTNWGTAVKGTTPMGVKFPCSDLWTTLYICWDGRVALCCKDYECWGELGNVNSQSLYDIWQKSYELKLRRAYNLNTYPGKPRLGNMCDDCLSNTHLVNPWWRVEL